MELQINRPALSLREQVEGKLRDAISGGVFKPGQRLVERELCELIGVGRTSVREALRQLEAEGLVTVYPNRGPVVSTLSADDARHLYGVRALLEGYAGRLFAIHRTAEELVALTAASDKLHAAARDSDWLGLVQAKADFYRVLLSGSRNPYAKQMLTTLHNRINLLRITSMTQSGRLDASLKEIRRILKAIRLQDPEEAEAACIAHVEAAAEVALRVLVHTEVEAAKA